ncbi:hypothetical protein CBA19CS11_30395 [Caballeronia novacaledonica]|uniref:hypothetical protein n=1 Tax=Caballeronia novacaledonica TaxID=1544861 RepID=UPI001EE35308|nr:hypothetical protein [Caballeronia novacaledonica]GJH13239.1 hypothetical protein CBA19CS11_30395 [Caballeronia novacaledonica]
MPGGGLGKTVAKAKEANNKKKTECDELEEDVDDEDEKIRKMRTTKKGAIAHKATTVTASKLTCKGVSTKKPAYSSLSRLPKAERKRYAQGVKKGSKMCKKNGKPFRHATHGFSSGCAHTEARLVEDAFGSGKGEGCKLSMRIRWKQRKLIKDSKGKVTGAISGPPKDFACENCERVLCHAKYCGLKIFLCKDDGSKSGPPNCENHGY